MKILSNHIFQPSIAKSMGKKPTISNVLLENFATQLHARGTREKGVLSVQAILESG